MPSWVNIDFLSRIIRRFQLEEWRREPESLAFVPAVFPITSADELLKDQDVINVTTGVLGVGSQIVYTVPIGKRVKFYGMYGARVGGDRNFDVIFIVDADVHVFAIETFGATSSKSLGIFNQPIIAKPGWTVRFSITGGTTDGAWAFRAPVEIEDAF